MTGKKQLSIFILLLACLLGSCERKQKSGHLQLKFAFSVDDQNLETHQQIYTNAAGNAYQVDEVKYFISDLKLYYGGRTLSINDKNSIHYVDYDIANTHTWNITDQIPAGTYDSIRFIFGLSAEKNRSNYFTDPPESNMAWPSVLGGGYHYLQINGKWDKDGSSTPFNFHTGIGQEMGADSVKRFFHNHFHVTVPGSHFSIEENKSTTLTLNMNINNWFTNPLDYDLNYWGGSIMENQAAQNVIKQNGWNVFSVKR